MVERQGLMMTAPLMLMYIPLFVSFLLPYPWSAVSFVLGFILMMVWSVLSIWLFPLLAKKFHWIWVQPTSDETAGVGWSWKGRFQIAWKRKPISEWIEKGVCPDGSLGFWQTYAAPWRPRVRHPRYWRASPRGRTCLFVFRHKEPYDSLFKEQPGVVVYEGFPADDCSVTWCVADEIMPRQTILQKLEAGQIKPWELPNHVPFVDRQGYWNPVFWVEKAAGTREIQNRMAMKAPMVRR